MNTDRMDRRRHADVILREGSLELSTRALIAPRFADPDFEDPRFDSSQAKSGKRSLKITPRQGLVHFPLQLVPGHRYRISVWVKRQETKGSVYANVHHHMTNKSHVFGHGAVPGAWTRLQTEYVMPPGMDQPHLYMYNWQGSTQPVWYDSVSVEDVGKETSKGAE